jgi:hypothetical protein
MKRVLLRILAIGVLSSFLFGLDYNQWEYTREDPAPVWNTDTVKFSFEDTYTGRDISLLLAEIEVVDSDENRVFLIEHDMSDAMPEDGIFIVPCRSFWEQVPDGLYGTRSRVFSSGGGVSSWSPLKWFQKDWTPVPVPGGCYLLR